MDQYVGEIRLVAFSFAPVGWALCDGHLLPINQNQALFSLLGTYYGGDGRTTFAVPDLRGRVPVGAGVSVTGTSYEVGSTGGQETVKLAVAQLPSHSHRARADKTASTTNNPTNAVPAVGGKYAAAQNANMSAAMVAKSGGGQAHENRQPYVSLTYIIALVGIFPSRN